MAWPDSRRHRSLPTLTFDLGADLDGLTASSLSKLGISLSLTASGDAATFDADANGAGIASTLDTGGPTQRSRINGGLATTEAVEFSFDTDVMLKSLSLDALNTDGTELVVLSFVSGDNPFSGLSGYDSEGLTLDADAITFDGNEAEATDFVLDFGILGRDELFLTAGTVLSLTADPATGGGILLSAISIAEPISAVERVLVDYNLDGQIDISDYDLWRTTFGSTSDLRADSNGDGIVDAAEYTIWRDAFTNSSSTQAQGVPEPSTVIAVLLAVIATLIQRQGRRFAA